MRHLRHLIFILLLCLTKFSLGQKVRLVGDVSQFVCVADSIEHFTIEDLKTSGVDSIITCLYDYDNGRVSNAVHYILWIKGGQEKIRVIKGCDNISIQDTVLNGQIMFLFNFYNSKKIDNTDGMLPLLSSHDMGYNVRNHLSTKEHSSFRVTNEIRDINDPRVLFINEFDKLVVSLFRQND